MDNSKSLNNILYMIRHVLTFNLTDPLSNASRGISPKAYTQYFSGTGASGQVNYLERKPTASGRFQVWVGSTEKIDGTDFTLDRDAGTITWDNHNPADGSDNIKTQYQNLLPWVYDDHPRLDISSFPRITVDLLPAEYETFGMGTYTNYNSGPGDYITVPMRIIIRNRKTEKALTINSIQYKNRDVVLAIAEEVINYFQTNRKPTPWEFQDWEIVRNESIGTEEDMHIYRQDVQINVNYFDKS